MKKRVISFILAIVIMIGIMPQFAFGADAATQLKYAPYANVEYEETSSVKCGTIRYVSQIKSSTKFYNSYWGSKWKKQASIECGTSSISMALSYIGINVTPKKILDDGKGSTVFSKSWGGSTYKGYNYTGLTTAMDRYINGNGKYSPPVIHLKKYSSAGHWVVLVGRVDSDTYQVLDPANSTIWNITINGKKASYTLPNGKKVANDTIIVGGNDVRQWYNKNAAINAEIITEPKNVKAFEGDTAKVTLKASGEGLTYKWYYKNPGAYTFSLASGVTGNSYSVIMNSSIDGQQVYCVVTDKKNNTDTSKTVTINLKKTAKITMQPISVAVGDGEKAETTVLATGDGLKYQWYFKNPGKSSYTKSSITSATYSTTMSSKISGRKVYCKITDAYGNSVKTNVVTLSMKKAAKITTQPKSVTVADGATAKVTVKATGDGLTYKWYYKNPGNSTFYLASGVTGTSYSAKMSSSVDGQQVYCMVIDKYGNSVASNMVTLSIKKTLKITTQPKSVSVVVGEKAKTTVKATGDGLKYQWYYKNPGKSSYTKSTITSATYSVTMTAKNSGRKIYCVITDKYGNTLKTSTVTLTTNSICKERLPAYGTIKATAGTAAMSLPCSNGTDANSVVMESVANGKTYTTTALILNKQGNHWYRIVTSSGEVAYVPSSKMMFVDDLTDDLKITGAKAPTTLTKGKAYSIAGTVTSTYNDLTKVGAFVYKGKTASGSAVTGGTAKVSGDSYSLKGSAVDNKVLFNKLPAGTYTYAVYAYYSNNYAKTETTSAENTGKVCVYTKTFTVK